MPESSKWSQVSPPKPCIHLSCPAHLVLLDLIMQTILGEECRSLSSSLCSFLHSPLNLFLLGPNILHSTLFPNTLNLRLSLYLSEHVSHPYKTTGKIITLYFLTFKCLDSILEEKKILHRIMASIP